MTNEKLNEANNLSEDIREKKNILSDLKNTYKRIELENVNGFLTNNIIKVRFDNNECLVNKDALCDFLQSQIEVESKELKELQTKFNEL